MEAVLLFAHGQLIHGKKICTIKDNNKPNLTFKLCANRPVYKLLLDTQFKTNVHFTLI